MRPPIPLPPAQPWRSQGFWDGQKSMPSMGHKKTSMTKEPEVKSMESAPAGRLRTQKTIMPVCKRHAVRWCRSHRKALQTTGGDRPRLDISRRLLVHIVLGTVFCLIVPVSLNSA